jgi:hypothetical protein
MDQGSKATGAWGSGKSPSLAGGTVGGWPEPRAEVRRAYSFGRYWLKPDPQRTKLMALNQGQLCFLWTFDNI